MPDDEPPRSQAARAAAELALVRVAHHYGGRPEFVLLGGLVPALLCARAGTRHAGTTDIDVQVDLEISGGTAHAARLEQALRNAEFEPDTENIWRWRMNAGSRPVVKFELLADLDDHRAGTIIRFAGCEDLGAVNLRGTGHASEDVEVRTLTAMDQGARRSIQVNVTGLAGVSEGARMVSPRRSSAGSIAAGRPRPTCRRCGRVIPSFTDWAPLRQVHDPAALAPADRVIRRSSDRPGHPVVVANSVPFGSLAIWQPGSYCMYRGRLHLDYRPRGVAVSAKSNPGDGTHGKGVKGDRSGADGFRISPFRFLRQLICGVRALRSS